MIRAGLAWLVARKRLAFEIRAVGAPAPAWWEPNSLREARGEEAMHGGPRAPALLALLAWRAEALAEKLEREFGWPDEHEPGTFGAETLRFAESLRRLARSLRRAGA